MESTTAAMENINPFAASFWQGVVANLLETAKQIGLRLVFALIILLIGWIIIKIIMWLVGKALTVRKFDETLKGFLLSCLKGVLWLLLITAIIDAIDLQLLSLGALIAAAGLAIGFAVGGIMSNFVAGVMILAKKPFIVGDYIEAQGVQGFVKRIDMFMTTLHSHDNRVISVPNLPLASDTVINYTKEKKRRVDLIMGVAYDADLVQTRKILAKIAKKHSKVLSEPATQIAVHELGDSSVNFVMRPWCKKEDYWQVYWDMHAQVKVALDNAGIGIPFPQRDIHLYDGVVAEPVEYVEEESESSEEVDEVVEKETPKKGSKAAKGIKKGLSALKSSVSGKKSKKTSKK